MSAEAFADVMHLDCKTCGAAANEYCTFETNGRRFRRHCPCVSRILDGEKVAG